MTETILFYVFAVLAVIFAIGVVAFRNPVTSAMNMALCFAATAGILFGLGAQFLGIVQIIVYAGAILVLFLFVVMMLDLKNEETPNFIANLCGVVVAAIFAAMVTSVAIHLPGACTCCEGDQPALAAQDDTPALPELKPEAAARVMQHVTGQEQPAMNSIPDTKLLGIALFSKYSIAFTILSFGLLAGAVGAVALSRKLRKD